MKIRVLYWLILFISLKILSMCSSTKSYQTDYFSVKQAWYQSWILKNNEKGTDIVIELSEVQPEVIFEDIIFRGYKIPVVREERKGMVILKATLITGESKLVIKMEKTGGPDQLIYTINGKQETTLLKNIRRKEIRYP